MKNTFEFSLDIKRQSNVLINRVVSDDTAVVFTIHVTDNGEPVTLDTDYNKVLAVFRRADGAVYVADNAVAISNSVVTVNVHPAYFSAGRNSIELQIYTRVQTTDTVYPDLITTEKALFNARKATLVGEGATAPSQLPMLEQLIADAQAAVTAANAAAASAASAVAAVKTEVVVLTKVNGAYAADKTYAELVAANTAGKTILCVDRSCVSAIAYATYTGSSFRFEIAYRGSNSLDAAFKQVSYWSDGTITQTLLGDANCDGEIDQTDASLINRYTQGLSEITPQGLLNADVNLDGVVNAADSEAILMYVVGGGTIPPSE